MNSQEMMRILDSIARVESLDVDWILPSHGTPFQGHRARLASMREHHDERCRRIREHIAREPLTVQALVERMWPRRLGLIDHNLALLEVLAHLEYLRRRGPVSADPVGSDGALAWRESG